ncbi:MAG: GNAT family N-acetyltransferase [Actinomycetota bacterium]|nr:GNAT family N-acetyltransferase [Actinomycetota bacterium]
MLVRIGQEVQALPRPLSAELGPWAALRDGRVVLVRPVEPTDRALVLEVFAGLSEDSRLRRFLAPLTRLPADELALLERVDHHDHEALAAVDAWSGEPLGVAHYLRLAPEGRVAEAAFAVVDGSQGQGVGRLLLGHLAQRAQDEGVTRLTAFVRHGNPRAVRLLSDLGRATATAGDDGTDLEIELDPDGAPSLPAQLGRLAWRSALAWSPARPLRALPELLRAVSPRAAASR